MVGKIAALASASQSRSENLGLPFLLAHPRCLGATVDRQREAAGLPELFVHRFAHALEQRRHVQEIVGRSVAHFARQLAQVGVQREQAARAAGRSAA